MQASEKFRSALFLKPILRLFFFLLYHPFAWTYDLVAAAVSGGRWVRWVQQVAPYLMGKRILELGHGPGHLQSSLSDEYFEVFGIDRSRQMGRIARRRLTRQNAPLHLARASAEALPFPNVVFDTVVATFPTEYIAHPDTLREIRRVLAPDGHLVVLLSAWITGRNLPDRALALLFRLTSQSQPALAVSDRSMQILADAGFDARTEWVELDQSKLLILVGVARR